VVYKEKHHLKVMNVYSWVYIIINNLSVSHFSVMNK